MGRLEIADGWKCDLERGCSSRLNSIHDDTVRIWKRISKYEYTAHYRHREGAYKVQGRCFFFATSFPEEIEVNGSPNGRSLTSILSTDHLIFDESV